VLGNDCEAVVGQGIDCIRKRSDEVHLEGVVVKGADTDSLRTSLSSVELGCTGKEHAGEPSIGTGGCGIQNPQPAVYDIMGGDGLSIGPYGVLAKLESILGSVFIGFPAFSNAGDC